MKTLRIAFVTQRYGREVNGGAETYCRAFAERMARYHEVEVLTTRAVDYGTWRNEYPDETSSLNGVAVRRFEVEPVPDPRKLKYPGGMALPEPGDPADEVHWIEAQGPYVPRLLRYLGENRTAYDLFLFQTYLYYTTCLGLPLVRDRAILIPTAHDEPPIYMSVFDEVFRAARCLICLTPEERTFLRRRFFDLDLNAEVIGSGLDPLPAPSPDPGWDTLRARIGESPFLLYAGRIDRGKGCGTMLEFFARYVAEMCRRDLKLVMIGKTAMPIPDHPQVVAAGFVPETTKSHAMRNCRFLIAPSPRESLCIAALEAWQAGKPVLANGESAVLRGQCRRSNGGLWYRDYDEFRESMDLLLTNDFCARQIGMQGREFVERNYTWDKFDENANRILSWAEVCVRAGSWTGRLGGAGESGASGQ